MEKDLFFSCGFQGEYDWVVLSNQEKILSGEVSDMLNMIGNIKNRLGGARLYFFPEPEVGIVELSVQCDGEKYLLTLVEYDKDGEYLIRTSNEYEYSDKLVYFEGELFPPSEVIKNFEIVKKAFVELLETGKVSNDLMSL